MSLSKKSKIIISTTLAVIALLVLHHFSKVYFFERKEIELCKQFLENNEKIIDLVGKIKNIETNFKSTYIEGYGENFSGRYSFIVHGSKAKERFFVYWKSNKGIFSVSALTLIQGMNDKEVWSLY